MVAYGLITALAGLAVLLMGIGVWIWFALHGGKYD